MLLSLLPPLLWAATGALGASYSPTLDVTNAEDLTNATATALKQLLLYFPLDGTGVFPQVDMPWATSGMVWMTFQDYLKYSGDGQFTNTVTDALVNMSYGTEQDFLNGAQAPLQETILGRWNDDILWPSQAVVAGAEIYGPDTIMGASEGPWITSAQRTFDQAYQQWNEICGGGIYWSRDRNSQSASYISMITNLEFIQQGARNYIQTRNETAFALTNKAMNWLWSSGMANYETGSVYDGVETENCGIFEVSQWSYNWGELIGALAWMHQATGNETYLTIANPFLDVALQHFFDPVTGVMEEECESERKCNRDQMTFKGILARNMAYLYRESSDESVRSKIRTAIDTTVAGMIDKSCDVVWNCGGNWTTDVAPVAYSQSQYVSSALLVAAMGIHVTRTGEGLLTDINVATLNTTESGTGTRPPSNGSTNPYVVSRPLGAATRGDAWKGLGTWAALGLVGAGVGLLL